MINDPVLLNDWHPVALSTDIPEGALQRARLLEEDLVLWRTGRQLMAWQDLCIHRGARLSMGRVVNDQLLCAYHGWRYGEDAKCALIPSNPDRMIPAKARVKAYLVEERYGLVWVCLGSPKEDIPPFPQDTDPGFRTLAIGPFGPVQAGGPRILENFLDIAHLPWLHGGTLGDQGFPAIADYEVERTAYGLEATNVRIYSPDPYGTGVGEDVVYTYRVYRPLTAYLAKHSGDTIGFSLLFPITPHDEVQSSAWFCIALNNDLDIDDQEFTAFTANILSEDVPVVEGQRPELLPIDLQAELHLKSDLTALAYRKWLRELGLTFGIA